MPKEPPKEFTIHIPVDESGNVVKQKIQISLNNQHPGDENFFSRKDYIRLFTFTLGIEKVVISHPPNDYPEVLTYIKNNSSLIDTDKDTKILYRYRLEV